MKVSEVVSTFGRHDFGWNSVAGDGDCAVRASLNAVMAQWMSFLDISPSDANIASVRALVSRIMFDEPLVKATWSDQIGTRRTFVERLFGGGRSTATDEEIAERIKVCGSDGGPWFSQEMMGALAIAMRQDIVVVCEGMAGNAQVRVYPKMPGYYKYDTEAERVLGDWKIATAGIDFSEYIYVWFVFAYVCISVYEIACS
jgi:hypothetical protein